MEPLQQFAANVRAERARRRLSQMQLANAAGLHFTAVSLIERAEREPSLNTVVRLARGLDVPPARLLRGIR